MPKGRNTIKLNQAGSYMVLNRVFTNLIDGHLNLYSIYSKQNKGNFKNPLLFEKHLHVLHVLKNQNTEMNNNKFL